MNQSDYLPNSDLTDVYYTLYQEKMPDLPEGNKTPPGTHRLLFEQSLNSLGEHFRFINSCL